jgi:hypothetical protein
MNSVSSKDSVLGSIKPRIKELYIPQWDKTVYIKKLSVAEARGLRSPMSDKPKTRKQLSRELGDWTSKIISCCILDKDYGRIFTVKQLEDLDSLDYSFLSIEVLEYNGIKSIDYDKAREELKKKTEESLTIS